MPITTRLFEVYELTYNYMLNVVIGKFNATDHCA